MTLDLRAVAWLLAAATVGALAGGAFAGAALAWRADQSW